MKFSISFALCGVLFGLISLLSVTPVASIREDDENLHECTGIYLKNKGKVEYDVPSNKTLSECKIPIQDLVSPFRNDLEVLAKRDLSNESTCVISGIYKSEFNDTFIQIAFVKTNSLLTRTEKDTTMTAMIYQLNDVIKAVLTKCGIDEDRLKAFMKYL